MPWGAYIREKNAADADCRGIPWGKIIFRSVFVDLLWLVSAPANKSFHRSGLADRFFNFVFFVFLIREFRVNMGGYICTLNAMRFSL